MSDESVSNKPPEVESTSPSPVVDSAGSDLDREIALHLPPADLEFDAGVHSPTQPTSPSLRRIARARARSRQAWLAAALFAGFACVALLWVTLFPGGTSGTGPEPRVSIESSQTARTSPQVVPAQTAAPVATEPSAEPAPAEVVAPPLANAQPEPPSDPVVERTPASHTVAPSSVATRTAAKEPRARTERPSAPEEPRATRSREPASAEAAPLAAPPPSSKFVFQPQ